MTAHKPVRKAVIPVAGYGTRFLPYTKSIPKEMLPIVDRPIIHHVAEEVAAAGITQIVLITGMNKRAIDDYFDYNTELEMLLESRGKHSHKKISREASDLAHFVYVRQKEQLGNGHAVLQAKGLIAEDEPFLVVWGDEMFMGSPSKVEQLVATYEEHGKPVIMTMENDADEAYSSYGYIVPGEDYGNGIRQVTGFVEKPGSREAAPSSFVSYGCMVLTGDIFRYLEDQKPGHGGEIVLGEVLGRYAKENTLLSKEITNLKYFDCGSRLGYMQATVEYALKREDIGSEFKSYLQELSTKL